MDRYNTSKQQLLLRLAVYMYAVSPCLFLCVCCTGRWSINDTVQEDVLDSQSELTSEFERGFYVVKVKVTNVFDERATDRNFFEVSTEEDVIN